jgi:hypothetical protein
MPGELERVSTVDTDYFEDDIDPGDWREATDDGVLPLTPEEQSRLVELEAVVDRHTNAILEVGRALCEIHERELYREEYNSWSEYVSDRWGSLTREMSYRYMAIAETVEAVPFAADLAPSLVSEVSPYLGENAEAAQQLLERARDEQLTVRAFREVIQTDRRQRREEAHAAQIAAAAPATAQRRVARAAERAIEEDESRPEHMPIGRDVFRAADVPVGCRIGKIRVPWEAVVRMHDHLRFIRSGVAGMLGTSREVDTWPATYTSEADHVATLNEQEKAEIVLGLQAVLEELEHTVEAVREALP